MSAKPQEWQNVDSGEIYVMVLKDDWEQWGTVASRAAEILRSNQRSNGSVSAEMINDVLGILDGRW
jgi:hypothetical protein